MHCVLTLNRRWIDWTGNSKDNLAGWQDGDEFVDMAGRGSRFSSWCPRQLPKHRPEWGWCYWSDRRWWTTGMCGCEKTYCNPIITFLFTESLESWSGRMKCDIINVPLRINWEMVGTLTTTSLEWGYVCSQPDEKLDLPTPSLVFVIWFAASYCTVCNHSWTSWSLSRSQTL